MNDRDVMQQALEALNLPSMKTQQMLQQRDAAIATLRAQLEQPEQEPVAWVVYSSAENDIVWADKGKRLKQNTPLYTYPLQQQAEPVAWRDAVESLVKGFEHVSGIARNWEPDCSSGADRAKWAQATEACADVVNMLRSTPPQRKPFAILAITTAYEQGVGKGHQAQGRSVEIENPYAPGDCQQAWAFGYNEGKKQAASKDAHGIGKKP